MTSDERGHADEKEGTVPYGVPAELLDHAVRCWEAELENARRQAIRTNLLLTVILTVLGLSAFGLGRSNGDTASAWPPGGIWVIQVILVGSLLLFVRAL